MPRPASAATPLLVSSGDGRNWILPAFAAALSTVCVGLICVVAVFEFSQRSGSELLSKEYWSEYYENHPEYPAFSRFPSYSALPMSPPETLTFHESEEHGSVPYPLYDENSTWGLANVSQNHAYQAYLKSFYRSAENDRHQWPWMDNHVFFDELGGNNGYQYSDADAAIDEGDAEGYGEGHALWFGGLNDDFNDDSFYGRS